MYAQTYFMLCSVAENKELLSIYHLDIGDHWNTLDRNVARNM